MSYQIKELLLDEGDSPFAEWFGSLEKSLSEPKWSYSSMSLNTAETMDGPMK
jgi:hypothetical protein